MADRCPTDVYYEFHGMGAEVCPYPCQNKTENGYCKTTGCINPKMNTVEVGFTTNDKEFNAFLKGVEAGRRDALEGLVRRKDCKWIDLCKDPEHYEYKGSNGFCSKGERKNDGEENKG